VSAVKKVNLASVACKAKWVRLVLKGRKGFPDREVKRVILANAVSVENLDFRESEAKQESEASKEFQEFKVNAENQGL
jgi:hypothetical protein